MHCGDHKQKLLQTNNDLLLYGPGGFDAHSHSSLELNSYLGSQADTAKAVILDLFDWEMLSGILLMA